MEKIYEYEEIKDIVVNFHKLNLSTAEKQNVMTAMLKQLGYTVKSCNCTSQTSKLYTKLADWLKHHDSICHYRLTTDRLLYYKDGSAITKPTFTDEQAQWLLETSGSTYVEQVLPLPEQQEVQQETQPTADVIDNLLEQEKQAKSGKRTVKSKKKITTKN